jgi:hypothetical protein
MNTRRIRFARGDHLHIRDGHGALITVGHGAAWLTQHDDRRDIVIEAGGSFRLDRPGVTMMSTDSTAEVTVTAATYAGLPVIETSRRAGHTVAASR